MRRPSDTKSGREWLANFKPADEEIAAVLLNSLRFVDLDTLRNDLIDGLEDLRTTEKIEVPALLVAERSLKNLEEDSSLDRRTAVAFEDFSPAANIGPTPGSEAMIGMVLRDFAAAGSTDEDNPWMAPDSSLDLLRTRRCRSIVLVTDYCGTGNQIGILADSIARNKTIKSWRSLKVIRIHVLAFAASPIAQHNLFERPSIDAVQTIEAAPNLDTAPWSKKQKKEILDLCLRENRVRGCALGYRRSGGLLATARGAPNNLPAIFWQQTGNWSPLFPQRKVPAQVARDLSGYQSSEALSVLATRVGQPRVSRNQRLEYMRPASRELLRALLLIHHSALTPAELAVQLGTSTGRTDALIGALRRFRFANRDLRITADGRREILAQKRALRRTTAGLAGSEATYYPHSLNEK